MDTDGVKQAALAGLLCAGAALAPAAALADECRLALLLALDVSSSVSAEEDALQREGLVNALLSPGVVAAFLANPDRHVALSVIEWSGRAQQSVLLNWTMIRSQSDLRDAAATLAASNRSYDDYPTALGYALGYAHGHFRQAPDCARQTLDISGDGLSNDGFEPANAYGAFDYSAITVNGLVIGQDRDVLHYYGQQVIRGPGAFVQPAADYEDYQRAMERKLRRELGLAIALAPVEAAQ